MSISAWRTIGYAGLIAAGLWLAYAGSAVATAGPGDGDAADGATSRSTPAAGTPQDDSATRVGARQVHAFGAHDQRPRATAAQSTGTGTGVATDSLSAAGSTAAGSGAQSATGRRATLQRFMPQAARNRGSGAAQQRWEPILTTVSIEVSTGATVRGTLQPEPVPEPTPAPKPVPVPVPGPGVDSRPPPVVDSRPPPVVEGRPGPGLGASPLPAAPPEVPVPESPPDEPPVIDVGGPVAVAGGGGGGAASAAGRPQPIRAPLMIPAPRAGAAAAPARPVLPLTPPAAAPPPAAQPPLPPAAGAPAPVPATRTGPGAPNAAPPAPRGATPAVPAQAPLGVAVVRGDAHRLGYPQYLRSARGTQIAAVALPGVAGLVLLTLGGGAIGYRQAGAGRMVRTEAAQRFLP